MGYARANLFYERESWKKPLTWSVVFHALLTASVLITGYLYSHRPVNQWGMNSGDAVSATLVSAAPIPVAPHTEESNNIVANDSKGVTETRPQPKPVETEDGISIPGKVKQPKITKTVTPPNPRPPRPAPTPEETAVPYGDKGPVSGPFGTFTAPSTQGGFSFQNAEFGSRFANYVRIVNQTVSRNWYKPDVAAPHRAYITFTILRNGSVPFNSVQVEQSSGVPSLDQMAMRAVQRSEFPPLPDGYNGSQVSVEFWFDYQR